jgi:hypothetical protein
LLLRRQGVRRASPLKLQTGTAIMSNYSDLYGGRFLTAVDLKAPVTTIIERVEEEIFARDGKPPRAKAVLYFKNATKGVVCNKTNATALATAFGEAFAGWVGKRVTVKSETTMYGTKLVPALRLYPINPTPVIAPEPPKAAPNDEVSDEIPW